MMDAFGTFDNVSACKGKTLVEWFGDLLQKSDSELDREGSNFLKVMTTWVIRQYADRRKGGVPTGQLGRFVYPEGQKIDFTRSVMIFIVRTLRKRGLRETDLSKKTPNLDLMVRAYDSTAQWR